jgi:hypothetical protein
VPDFARYLPLSQRSDADESAIDGDWRDEIAVVLDEVAAAVGVASADEWDSETLRPGWRPADVIVWLDRRFELRRRERIGASIRLALTPPGARSEAEMEELDGVLRPDAGEAALRLVGHARTFRRQDRRGTIAELDAAVFAALAIGHGWARPIRLAPVTSGAVALRRAAAAPTELRAVIRGHSLLATDAGWTIGHGPVLAATADGLLLFLTGLSDAPPTPGTASKP